jgi:hypothetical protein
MVTGEDPSAYLALAQKTALESITPPCRQRLVGKVIERRIREEMFRHLPSHKDIVAGNPIEVSIDPAPILAQENSELEQALSDGNLLLLVTRYPLRETPALNKIAEKAGFKGRDQYERATRKLLQDDADALAFVRSLFTSLIAEMGV